MNSFIPSFLVKFEARKALKGHWQTAMLVSFCAGILNTAAQLIAVLNTAGLQQQLLIIFERSSSPEVMLEQMLQTIQASNLLLVAVCSLVAFLLTPAVSMGANAYYLKRMTGQPTQFTDLFCRINILPKSIALSLLIWIRVFLWGMLPTGALAVIIFLLGGSMSLGVMQGLVSTATAAATVLMLIAYCRYAMAVYVMAHHPETGVLTAIRESKAIMQNRKMQLFSLLVSFIGWSLLINLGGNMLAYMAGGVVASAAVMFGSLALSVYMSAARAGFYLHACGAVPISASVQFPPSGNSNQNDK